MMFGLLFLLVTGVGLVAPLNVLVVSTVSSPSHHIWVSRLTDGLLAKGHHVTELVLRPPEKHANKTSFYITEKTYGEHPGLDLEQAGTHTLAEEIPFFYHFCEESINVILQSSAFQSLVQHLKRDKPHFDVFLIDYVMAEPLLALGTLVNRPPVVALTAFNLPEDIMELMGSPYFASLLPYMGVGAHGGTPMDFGERVYNFVKWVMYKAYIYWSYRPFIENTITTTFPNSPPLSALLENVSVSLVNTVPALHGAMPLVPGVVEVGGLQIRPAKQLPDDILAWVDKKAAPHGFIFMSFGTNVRSANLAKDRRDAILRAFSRVKQRVLWKYEDDDIMDKLPPNVRVAKWLPQNDLLGHPNIRCFVSHNGGLSTQEASYHGVPILGVPFFVDQTAYAEKVERTGLGRRLQYKHITEERFYEALTDVLENPRYRENIRRVGAALKDQKETPLERAVWWVEYVARTGGAPHLRAPSRQLHWYQVFMLDVIAVLAAALLLCSWLAFRSLSLIVSALPSSGKKTHKD
ncbi:UDP-glycosyltransferase UGT5-like [Frankliniella occidentalis]|uniref:UDP-glycosyltransferase UGT5-like n=1 Tax=Frankliniella occidentalis TaxID=133901 RepID=A0A9C6U3A9_FRAOC|nr:UDP-glycosyltransferase UGT5-like [Frankliniella occidentalis]